MTSAGVRSMGLFPHEIDRPRARLSRFLREHYSGAHAVKRLARDLGASPKAAENMLCEHWPNDLHLAAIVRRFGKDIWSAVFEPEIAPVLARLEGEERRLDRQLQAIRAQRRQMARRDDGHPDLFEALEAKGERPD